MRVQRLCFLNDLICYTRLLKYLRRNSRISDSYFKHSGKTRWMNLIGKMVTSETGCSVYEIFYYSFTFMYTWKFPSYLFKLVSPQFMNVLHSRTIVCKLDLFISQQCESYTVHLFIYWWLYRYYCFLANPFPEVTAMLKWMFSPLSISLVWVYIMTTHTS